MKTLKLIVLAFTISLTLSYGVAAAQGAPTCLGEFCFSLDNGDLGRIPYFLTVGVLSHGDRHFTVSKAHPRHPKGHTKCDQSAIQALVAA